VGTFKAAFKAFTFNKVSDAALIFAIVIMSLSFQDLSIQTILAEVANLNTLSTESVAKVRAIELAATSLVIAASIKSAQLIGHL
jgi:NADH:ubiquinone oxidoreductase subunit 5 (subunit L)/multisubunit Na+/H+ antiporter MnhA subunit